MSKELINGYFYFKSLELGFFLMIDSSNINAYIELINKEGIKNIYLSSMAGFKLKNTNFLCDCSKIEKVWVVDDDIDISGVNFLMNITVLISASSIERVSFDKLLGLSYLSVDWNENLKSITECKHITHLRIDKFPLSNLENLPSLENIKSMHLGNPKVFSLKGIEKYDNTLLTFGCYHARKLQSIESLKLLHSIQSLEIQNCKNISDFSILGDVISLRKIILSNCGRISSLSFIRSLSNLAFISFVDTFIEDGDMTPTIGIEYVGFDNKKSYSHKLETVRKLSQDK